MPNFVPQKKIGGSENIEKSERALADSKKIAPEIGQIPDEVFNKSYRDTVEIVDTFSEEEIDKVRKICASDW